MTKILITAGMDGDEYAGVAAAKKLLTKKLKNVTVVPIVNTEGYKKGVSFNPLDHAFPKHVFPGKEMGSPTQRLMYHLATDSIYKCSIWIDLHGGAKDEQLYPFIHIGKSKSKELMKLIDVVMRQFHHETIILDKDGIWPFTQQLDKKGILYLRFEAGEKGKIEKKWVDTLRAWVQKVIDNTHREIPGVQRPQFRESGIFSQIIEYKSSSVCQWKPVHFRSPSLQRDQALGVLMSQSKKTTLYAKATGQLLWWKMAGSYAKGEILVGQAVIK